MNGMGPRGVVAELSSLSHKKIRSYGFSLLNHGVYSTEYFDTTLLLGKVLPS